MSVKLSGDRYEEIKNEVVCLFEKADVHCMPINGYEIAASLNVNVIPYSAFTASKRELAIKLSPDGFAAFDSGKWRICVNDDGNIAFGRRNFTILHELGHIVLKHTEDSDLADAEANFFAKFAQCPPILIYQYGLTSVGDIMERFGVTLSSAKYALAYYNKWQRNSGQFYTNYEVRTCKLFGIAV